MPSSKHRASKRTSTINPLANAKGVKRLCEVCQKPAHLQCTECGVTFYCDTEHQRADWVGIHQRICQLLVPIRTPPPSYSLLSDRDARRAQTLLQQEQLIEISREVAQSKLSEGKYQEALPAARLSLRCAMDVYGPSAVQLVPAYLLLGEANMGLGSLAQAEEYLSQAEWTVMKTPDCGRAVRHRLHRSLGRLHTAKGNLEDALLSFANDVYHASEEYGLHSTVACSGYFLMANVFVKQGKMPVACSLYAEVASTWHSHLTKQFESHNDDAQKSSEAPFDKAQQAELEHILTTILDHLDAGEKGIGQEHTEQTALVTHCLAMLWYLGGDCQKALEFGSRALQLSKLDPNHNLTEPIQDLLQLVRRKTHTPQ